MRRMLTFGMVSVTAGMIGCSTVNKTAEPPSPPAAPEAMPADPIGQGGTAAIGKIPESLAGTWFGVQVATLNERSLNGWRVFRIKHDNQGWSLQQLWERNPPFAAALKRANDSGVAFECDASTARAMKDRLASLSELTDPTTPTKVYLRDPEHFTHKPNTHPPEQEGALLGIEILSRDKSTALSALVFYAREIDKNTIRGTWSSTNLSAVRGPGLMPIRIGGNYTWTRIE
ncbi:MAG: hypothetical protein HY270_07430 [Deltaproteobacteria bacterium]|nr:hypothetical protein [Deltaproteobacteria bacterium]